MRLQRHFRFRTTSTARSSARVALVSKISWTGAVQRTHELKLVFAACKFCCLC